MKKNNKNVRGITLIALVITIIVLLILAGVSIVMLGGQNGILTKAKDAASQTNTADAKEQVKLAVMGSYGQDGIDLGELKKNLDNIGATIKDSSIDLPWEVTVNGQTVVIKADGTVENKNEGESESDSEIIVTGSSENWQVDANTNTIIKYIGDMSEFNGNDVIIPNYVDNIQVLKIGSGKENNTIFTKTQIENKNIEISKGIKEINDYCFYEFNNITFKIPSSVIKIGNCAFCLTIINGDLVINDGVQMDAFVGPVTVNGNLLLGDSVKGLYLQGANIGGNLVMGNGIINLLNASCSNLKIGGTLTLGKNIKVLEDACFNGIKFKGDLVIPDSVTKMGQAVFQGAIFDGDVIIGNSVEKIEAYDFNGCTSTGKLTIGTSVKEIVEYGDVFSNSKFSEIIIPENVTKIGEGNFGNLTSSQTIKVKGYKTKPIGWSDNWLQGCNAVVEWQK